MPGESVEELLAVLADARFDPIVVACDQSAYRARVAAAQQVLDSVDCPLRVLIAAVTDHALPVMVMLRPLFRSDCPVEVHVAFALALPSRRTA